MSNKYDLSYFVLGRYTLHTSYRNSKTGGGVTIHVNDGFNQKVMCNISKVIEDCMETIFIEIAVKNIKVQIDCIYRAPNTDICIFNEELQVICQTLKHNPTFICGDFNINLFKY